MNGLSQAIECHQQGRLKHAETLYLSHLQAHPKDTEALRLIGMLYWQMSDFDRAKYFLEHAFTLGTPSARLLGNLGLIKQHYRQFDEAITFYRQSLALETNAVSLSNLGVVLRYKNDLSGSKATLSRAHALLPNEESVLLNLCTTLRLMKQYDHALKCMNHFCEHNELSASICSEKARIHLANQSIRLADQWIQKALSINAHDPSIWINLALIRKAVSDWDSALDALDQALSLQPLLVEVYVQYAQILQAQRLYDQALEACREGLRYFPDDLALNKEMVYVLSELDLLDEAERLTDHLLRSDDDPDLWLQKGHLLLERYALTEASTAFEHCLRLDPKRPQAQHFLDASKGRIPKKVNLDYVRGVFDDYAERFEQHLLHTLNYQVPEIFEEMLTRHVRKSVTAADLGCGTGLLGPLLKRHVDHLIGVDISPKMIAKARQRGVYDSLIINDIEIFLTTHFNFDLLAAGDVFNYLGPLEDVLAAIFSALRPSGLCIFTLEATAEPSDGVVLSPNGRFQHSMCHVKKILKDHPFNILDEKWVKLRQEGKQWVRGIVVVLQKP